MGCHRLKPAGAADCRSELLRSEFAFVTGYVCCGRLCYCAVQHPHGCHAIKKICTHVKLFTALDRSPIAGSLPAFPRRPGATEGRVPRVALFFGTASG